MRVTRIDFAGPARSVHRTPQGGLRVEAAIARSGVLPYSDGTREWKEYRPPAEVFKADSMATAKGGPVTDLHPPKLVTPETFKAHRKSNGAASLAGDAGTATGRGTARNGPSVAAGGSALTRVLR